MGPHRVNVINTLQLIAATPAQIEYQLRVPNVNVASELVNQWFSDFYHPGDARFESEFSAAELNALSEFNQLYDTRVSQLPKRLPAMMESPVWLEVVASARKTLQTNGWLDVLAKYDR